MMILFRFCLVLLLVITGISCASLRSEKQSHGVTHVVVCWLKEAGNKEARQRLIEVSRNFRMIPGVVDVTAGNVLLSKRPQVDSSFDVAVVITFFDKQAMVDYENHSLHQKAVHDVLIPLVSKYVVYDFTNDH